MAALPQLITVAEFLELPEGGEFVYELHGGEVFSMTRAKFPHLRRQHHVYNLLARELATFGLAWIEFPYRPLGEFDLRAADIAVISHERAKELEDDPAGVLRGAPDLVIEVKSPSNRKGKLTQLAALCLNNGAKRFWVLDEANRTITVMEPDGVPRVYRSGEKVPLQPFASTSLAVDAIFA